VRVSNTSAVAFDGYVRCTVDVLPKVRVGIVETADGQQVRFVVGRACGLDTRTLDLRVALAPHQDLTIELDVAKPWAWKPTPLPAKANDWFQGQVSIAGVQCKRIELESDGAGYTAHWRARVGAMLLLDLWLTWYPDSPSWATGEALVTASNCTVPDMGAVVPAGFFLKVGKALVFSPECYCGAEPLIAEGTSFGDGQARIVPITIVFPQHLSSDEVWSNAGIASNRKISAVGVQKLWGCGNPRMRAMDARRWAEERLPEAVRRLSTWDAGIDGPQPFSAQPVRRADRDSRSASH
jgi:hypothetical protein